jgi:phosphoribosylformylglycinamidine cyclo-ligase
VLRSGLCARIQAQHWALPDVFNWLRTQAGLSPFELVRTFNCGIGMAVVVKPDFVQDVCLALRAAGEHVYVIGEIVPEERQIRTRIDGSEGCWGYPHAWHVAYPEEMQQRGEHA